MADVTIWGIHGGRTGRRRLSVKKQERDRDRLAKAGDLSKIGGDRGLIKAVVREGLAEKASKAMSVSTPGSTVSLRP